MPERRPAALLSERTHRCPCTARSARTGPERAAIDALLDGVEPAADDMYRAMPAAHTASR
jgi:hypothetical protein